jgi:hypothetical protein
MMPGAREVMIVVLLAIVLFQNVKPFTLFALMFFLRPPPHALLVPRCPAYEEVVDFNGTMNSFDPVDYEGRWFVAVHDEPTQPSFCGCDVYDWALVKNSNPVEYRSSMKSMCLGWQFTVELHGFVSSNPHRPGEHTEVS